MVTVLQSILGLLLLLYLNLPIIQTARLVNDGKARWCINQVKTVLLHWKKSLVALPGLAVLTRIQARC